MNYPGMKTGSTARVTIPKLSGGLNLRDASNMVADNQLTDCSNVWWKDGALRTRPGTVFKGSKIGNYQKTDINILWGGKNYALFYSFQRIHRTDPSALHKEFIPILVGEDGTVLSDPIFPSIPDIMGTPHVLTDDSAMSCLVFDGPPTPVTVGGVTYRSSGIYAVFGCTTVEHSYKTLLAVYELDYSEAENRAENPFIWNRLQDTDIYAPLILINGKGDGYDKLPTTDDTKFAPASTFEGVNLLCRRCHAQFVSDGQWDQSEADGAIGSCSFTIPAKIKKNSVMTVKLYGSFVQPNDSLAAVYEFKIDLSGGNTFSHNENGAKGYTYRPAENSTDSFQNTDFYASYNGKTVAFFHSNGMPAYPEHASVSNNIDIYFYLEDSENQGSIFDMTIWKWFGGSTELNGGTRLFLGGNVTEPNLIRWSDANRPLYFSENTYAYVGAPNERVTAFAKQSNMMVIFKEHETYYTVYSGLPGYSASDLQTGRVVDVTVVDAVFPITQIHGSIGCDCPDTIQLCNNRLVWANTEKKVYLLQSATAYSENNILEISSMMERDLKANDTDAMKQATSVDWESRYLLLLGKTAYVLDYLNPLSLYNQSWCKWDLSGLCATTAILCNLDNCCFVTQKEESISTFLLDGTVDIDSDGNAVPIESMIQTKLFDFGTPDRYKKIEHLYLGIGKNPTVSGGNTSGSGNIHLEFLTERGRTGEVRTITADEIEAEAPQYSTEKRISVMQPRVSKFGLKLTASGTLSVDSFILTYQTLGGVK